MNKTVAVSSNAYPDNIYVTPPDAAQSFSRFFPNLSFYLRMGETLRVASSRARRGIYTDADWIGSSLSIRNALEQCGTKFTIEGMDNFKNIQGPCVFVGNHMSTLETFVLPGIVCSHRHVTFVVKQSLLDYPFFRHVMRSRNPIAVQRKDPRADFTTVMQGGLERLEQGISVIIFPQSTRCVTLDRQLFNSMGVKLARRANVPVVPVALRTDAWGMGGFFGLLKDHGRVYPEIPVNIRFGKPIAIEGNGKAQHDEVYSFIENSLAEWGLPPTPSAKG